MDLTIFVDGKGLPRGAGTVRQGEAVFARNCAACHGNKGQGGSAEELVGGIRALDSADPDRTIGRFWPHATTVFDYIRRAMPANKPGSLTNDEVYAVTAWLLHADGLLDANASLDANSLPLVHMPNREGFVRGDASVSSRLPGRTVSQ
jgi:cytochrome c